jgi:hypothetical protein
VGGGASDRHAGNRSRGRADPGGRRSEEGEPAADWAAVQWQPSDLWLWTTRAVSLPAPVAFAAALIGGALGGILFAFLALPAAGVMLAAVRTYGRYYEVVEDDKTVVPALAPPKPAKAGTRRRYWFSRRHHGPPGPRGGKAPDD